MPSPLACKTFFISNAGKRAQEIGAETFLSVLLICFHAENDSVAKTKWQLKTRRRKSWHKRFPSRRSIKQNFSKLRSCETSLFEEGTSNSIHNSIRIDGVERKLMRFCIVIGRQIEDGQKNCDQITWKGCNNNKKSNFLFLLSLQISLKFNLLDSSSISFYVASRAACVNLISSCLSSQLNQQTLNVYVYAAKALACIDSYRVLVSIWVDR